MLFARARGSGQPQVSDAEHSESSRRNYARCTEIGALFYSQALDTVVPVSSTQVAEMVKLLENTFRMINIGLVNELALMCERMGINVWEVIDAAATKPFGFMPFYPGPGTGRVTAFRSIRFIFPGRASRPASRRGSSNWRDSQRSDAAFRRRQDPECAQRRRQTRARLARTHLGVAYKRDIDDVRESPALDIIHLLTRRGAEVTYTDPHVPRLRFESLDLKSEASSAAASADCAVIVTDHSVFDYGSLVNDAKLIVDTRNALKKFSSPKIVRL